MNFIGAIILGAGFYIGHTFTKGIDEALGALIDEIMGGGTIETFLEKHDFKIEKPKKSEATIGFKS